MINRVQRRECRGLAPPVGDDALGVPFSSYRRKHLIRHALRATFSRWRRLRFCICTMCVLALANIVSQSEISLLHLQKYRFAKQNIVSQSDISSWHESQHIECNSTYRQYRREQAARPTRFNFAFCILNLAFALAYRLFLNGLSLRLPSASTSLLRWRL